MIPEGTTHVWTPAVQRPYVGLVFRRAYYKYIFPDWYCFSLKGEWCLTNNDPMWFAEEQNEGYLVMLETFVNPTFTPKKEKYEHA